MSQPDPAMYRHRSNIWRFLREYGTDPDPDIVGITYTKCGRVMWHGYARVLPRPPAGAPMCPGCQRQR